MSSCPFPLKSITTQSQGLSQKYVGVGVFSHEWYLTVYFYHLL